MGKLTTVVLIILVMAMFILIPAGIKDEIDRSSWCRDHGYKSVRTGQYGPSLCYDPNTRQVYNPE